MKKEEDEKKLIAFSIPTGVGAQIGGFAGDCGHIAREFAKYFKLMVNPNVVNAGIFSAITEQMFYVEGYAFDGILAGELKLQSVQKNKIGVIFDKAIPKQVLNVHINTINAAKVVWGLDIFKYETTKKDVGVKFTTSNGFSSGSVENPKTILEAGKSLIRQGAQALAVVCLFEEHEDDKEYSNGLGTDPIGGVEAIISHYLTKELMVPVAHSPAFKELDISTEIVSEKASAEYVSSTYLPCILQGLSQAPQISPGGEISTEDIAALVVPSDTLGSKAVLGCIKNNIPIYTVKNPCQISVTCQKLKLDDIIEFDNYGVCLDFLRKKFYGK